jgi:two-component system response regulator CitB
MSVEEVVENVGISKTTGRRYLEYCVESGLISIEMLYGNIGHPRRLYRKAPIKNNPQTGWCFRGFNGVNC